MSFVRLVRFGFAVLIAATQWVAFSTALVHAQSARAVASGNALPVIVVRAHRQGPKAIHCYSGKLNCDVRWSPWRLN